jgi:hypothetical protein
MYASYVTGRFTVVTISNCLTCDRKVYRGMSGVKLPECFMIAEEGGGKGGVDFAFVSTSTDRTVATSYVGGKEMPILFEFEVGDVDRGASLSFLSQYPNESEILIPPLSYLEVTGEPFLEHTEKGDVWVYPARINCNLKSQVLLRGGVGGSARASERERDREREKERKRDREREREREREYTHT